MTQGWTDCKGSDSNVSPVNNQAQSHSVEHCCEEQLQRGKRNKNCLEIVLLAFIGKSLHNQYEFILKKQLARGSQTTKFYIMETYKNEGG